MQTGDRVYVAEYGHGARAGTVVRVYELPATHVVGIYSLPQSRVIVQLDEQTRPRDCYAGSVFPTQQEAEQHAKP